METEQGTVEIIQDINEETVAFPTGVQCRNGSIAVREPFINATKCHSIIKVDVVRFGNEKNVGIRDIDGEVPGGHRDSFWPHYDSTLVSIGHVHCVVSINKYAIRRTTDQTAVREWASRSIPRCIATEFRSIERSS